MYWESITVKEKKISIIIKIDFVNILFINSLLCLSLSFDYYCIFCGRK